MMFWLICVLVMACAMIFIGGPLVRRAAGDGPDSPDVALYHAQLAEIDRDMARDLIAPAEAELARAEVARRLLSANKNQTRGGTAPTGLTAGVAWASAAIVLVVSFVSYLSLGTPGEPDQPLALRHAMADDLRENRPSQAEREAQVPPRPGPQTDPEYQDLIIQLRALMETRPNAVEGWVRLARAEANLGNYAAAAQAQAQVIALKGEAVTLGDRTLQLDLMVFATDGFVSPEAETLARAILDTHPDSVPALFYMGELYAQTDRADIAFRLWRPLVESGVETFHSALARSRIADIAQMAGVNYTPPDQPGPTADDIAAADDMSPQARQAMIEGMVARLSDRLATTGGGPADWARLIGAYGVLGDTENANAIWTEAREVYATSPEAMTLLEDAARRAGVLE